LSSLDEQIRLTAFNWLRQQADIHNDVLSRELLADGFIFENEKIPLVAPQGIFKPRLMEFPLSITTTTESPYDDGKMDGGYLVYKYRGSDINHRDNVGLRECMKHNLPLIYLHSIIPGKYVPFWPVYIVGDDPASLSFKVALDDFESVIREKDRVYESDARRIYLTSTIRVRLHQRGFRERVLHAYQSQCSLCRLKHLELLDAAHIIPDGEPESKPTVDNGLALCKLHHAAFDSFIIGITPDYQIEIRKDILDESDGPMLQHGLKGLHNSKIYLPRHKTEYPNKNFLDIRYQRFRNAS
jgi:putative restriction endonuclease